MESGTFEERLVHVECTLRTVSEEQAVLLRAIKELTRCLVAERLRHSAA